MSRGELRADRLLAPLAAEQPTHSTTPDREIQPKADRIDAGAKKDSKTK
jgi:hypothetical protein